MEEHMRQYLDLMRKIRDEGVVRGDRTGTGTKSLFGAQMRFDLAEGFPLVTTKRVHLKSIIYELLWFLRGDTNIAYLKEHGVSIWDEWATEDGELGPMYGTQWRRWRGRTELIPVAGGANVFARDTQRIDQIAELIVGIKTRPYSRRHIVTTWNPADLPNESIPAQENVMQGKAALATCHCLFQFYVADGKLSCQLYQRSADFFLGVPFNIASYALLTMMIAQVCGLKPGEFVWTGGDTHLYLNHMEQVEEQLSREPRPLPRMHIVNRGQGIDDFLYTDFVLSGYDPHPSIKAPIAV